MSTTALSRTLDVFEAINSGDFSCLEDAVTAGFVDHGSPIPLPPGPDGYRQILTVVHYVLRIRYTVEDAFATAERVVVRALARGEGIDSVHGPGAAGKAYTMTTTHIYRVEDGRLAEHWGVRDEFGARVQLGTLSAPELPGPEAS